MSLLTFLQEAFIENVGATTVPPACSPFGYFLVTGSKHLDRPQLLTEEFKVADDYALGHHPDNRCVLGDLALRILLWLRVEPELLRASVAKLSVGPPGTVLEHLMQETFDLFWDLEIRVRRCSTNGWIISNRL